jgi:hypothetical protein
MANPGWLDWFVSFAREREKGERRFPASGGRMRALPAGRE